MARPTTLPGSKVLILLGDGASPEIYDAPCGLTTKGIAFTATTNDVNVPDCDDPDAPMWVERIVSALSAGVTGSGILALESQDEWRAWFMSGQSKNIQVKLDDAMGGTYAMEAVLTNFNITGNQGELTQVEVTIASNGEVTYTPAT